MEKAKNGAAHRLQKHIFISGLCAVVLIGVIIGVFINYSIPSDGEKLVIPFTSERPIYTEQFYSGQVILRIDGKGRAAGKDYSDAFYMFGWGDWASYDPPILGEFAMELDGQKIHEALGYTPAYDQHHRYVVTYNVGREPRRIGFRNTDLTTEDNWGEYTVEVISAQEEAARLLGVHRSNP